MAYLDPRFLWRMEGERCRILDGVLVVRGGRRRDKYSQEYINVLQTVFACLMNFNFLLISQLVGAKYLLLRAKPNALETSYGSRDGRSIAQWCRIHALHEGSPRFSLQHTQVKESHIAGLEKISLWRATARQC